MVKKLTDFEVEEKAFDLACMKFLAKYDKPISLGELKLLIFKREIDKLPDQTYYRTYKKDTEKHKAGEGFTTKGKGRTSHFKILRMIFPHFVESNLDKYLRLKVGVGYKRRKTKSGKRIQWTPETNRFWRKKEKQKEKESSPEYIAKMQKQWEKSIEETLIALIDRVKGLRTMPFKRGKKEKRALIIWFNIQIDNYIQELENMLL